ncbi:hypothetical protein Cgig2_018418 [Carnegiea gigantea]|uniref:Hydroxymethylglutaryl-CoA reductase (NADPH) n=1 Tax=Carnegiea gigantea TaxID=171969 RepID=A0A9Q1Q672_9CARY|nr:hypothetical protein Cgig2_018418 [Carnegiea gigantea]
MRSPAVLPRKLVSLVFLSAKGRLSNKLLFNLLPPQHSTTTKRPKQPTLLNCLCCYCWFMVGTAPEPFAASFNRPRPESRLQTLCSVAVGGGKYYLHNERKTDMVSISYYSAGDAMGMNIVSKGVKNVLDFLLRDFLDVDVIGISGNYCFDKKPAAMN